MKQCSHAIITEVLLSPLYCNIFSYYQIQNMPLLSRFSNALQQILHAIKSASHKKEEILYKNHSTYCPRDEVQPGLPDWVLRIV